MNWVKLLEEPINFSIQTKTLPTKGNLVYEYNPFRNYRLTSNMYEYKEQLYSLGDLWKYFKITICVGENSVIKSVNRDSINNVYNYTFKEETDGETTSSEEFGNWVEEAFSSGRNGDRYNLEKALSLFPKRDKLTWYGVPDNTTDPLLKESGQLVDFITDELNISLNHPVHIVPQYSYDGSVNLIINDGVNIPRLINSRFSATGKNTYEIIDRKGNNDTNIYDLGTQFDIDTSLYKKITKIPKINFLGVNAGGNLKVGNYHFYFKLADADGNETDFIGESGLVSVFIGFDSPHSVHTGQKNQNSFKQVSFCLTNIDSAYDYISVYYSRSTAEAQFNSVTEYAKIDKKYVITNSDICNITITGFEDIQEINVQDINLFYNTVDAVTTSAVCLNMLFMANVHKPDIPYNELQDLSLRFLPYLKEEKYNMLMNHEYGISTSEKGYIDPKFIYNKTGYWGNELYRIGIVYILNSGELSPVFNIRGRDKITTYLEDFYTQFSIYDNGKRNYIDYDENSYLITGTDLGNRENVKGVIRFTPDKDTDTIYSIDIRVDDDTILELKKYVKGYFFVRQKRIPTVLAQGITIGIDKESRTPTIPTVGGFLSQYEDSLENTHVTTDIRNVNYISEGFLSRYRFEFKDKASEIWKTVGKTALISVGVIALAAATIFTAGAAGAIVTGATLGAATVAGATAVGSSAIITGAAIAGGAAIVGTTVVAGVDELLESGEKSKKLDGRNTKVPDGQELVETNESRLLTKNFYERFIPKDSSKNTVSAILCPDYEINSAYYNQIFTGNTHLIELTNSLNINCLNGYESNYFTNDYRHFYVPSYYDRNIINSAYFKIIPVPDNVKCVGIENTIFRARAGEAEEAYLYECIANDYKSEKSNKETESNKKINSDIIRGSFGSYLAFNNESDIFQPAETVNIYIPDYSKNNMDEYFNIRMRDNSTYNAISDRYDINEIRNNLISKSIIVGLDDMSKGYLFNVYRGDCYICQFTHRINRNFNDPSAPYNDEIVDELSWKDNYDPNNTEKYANINLGDVNAVPLGMWVTFKVRSSNNLNIRTLDSSNVEEIAMSGHERGYYPYYSMSVDGSYKLPDSQVYNKGFTKSLSDKWNVLLPDVPHIKNWFGTRIMYSDIHINDAYKNGFRTFLGTNYRDYTREYGSITKIVPFESSLLVVFEHGVALLPVNERAVAGLGAGGNVYINTSNVLPENPKIISDMFGSQWPESVLKIPGKTGDAAQYVYGVDTVAKKIWRTDGNTLLCISDMRVQEFLNNNITLGERELTPKIGIRNVKTVYNAFKRDVLFTFYDNTYGFEEKVWNLCWNELLEKFITFYSWVPSYMENINNIPFSFNRDTSKWIAKLGTSHTESSIADGITLSNVIINNNADNGIIVDENKFNFKFKYIDKLGKEITKTYTVAEGSREGFIGVLSLSNRVLPDSLLFYLIEFKLERDQYLNKEYFKIEPISVIDGEGIATGIILPNDAKFAGKTVNIYALKLNSDINKLFSELYYRNSAGHAYADSDSYKIISTDEININLPIFKDSTGKRIPLKREDQINPDKIVRLLNIKATITIEDSNPNIPLPDDYYNLKSGFASGTSLIDAGYYESTVAVIPKWNLQFLSSDFWKHGQGGLIDIADDIYPTYWYGKQHPFEFECIVVNDPSVHKIFTNLELVANKAKPESFHYEIIGETYDFAKDKPNMYFRQEALKALWLYNGEDICYNRDFLKIQPKQQPRSADLPHTYYTRVDTINEVEDYYTHIEYPMGHDYSHLSGSEIVYYPNRQEFRIWNHAKAISLDELSLDDARSIIVANCQYLEDRWRVTINPILVCYKNEYKRNKPGVLVQPENSTWTNAKGSSQKLPNFAIYNSPIPDKVKDSGVIEFPGEGVGEENALYNLYENPSSAIDVLNWLNLVEIYGISFGEAQNRKEVDVRDKFMKVRIRYSGEELAVIDFLNTIYRVSYA